MRVDVAGQDHPLRTGDSAIAVTNPVALGPRKPSHASGLKLRPGPGSGSSWREQHLLGGSGPTGPRSARIRPAASVPALRRSARPRVQSRGTVAGQLVVTGLIGAATGGYRGGERREAPPGHPPVELHAGCRRPGRRSATACSRSRPAVPRPDVAGNPAAEPPGLYRPSCWPSLRGRRTPPATVRRPVRPGQVRIGSRTRRIVNR